MAEDSFNTGGGSESMNEQAEADARQDIADEGERSPEENEFLASVMARSNLRWYGSYATTNTKTLQNAHGIISANAKQPETAVGVMYLEIMTRYRVEDGWLPPNIVIEDEPALFIPGFGSFISDGACPDCGDPAGQCPDPNDCENIIELEEEDLDKLDPAFVEDIRREVRERAEGSAPAETE